MKRYALSLAILILGLFWVSVDAPIWGGQSLLKPAEPTPVATPTTNPAEWAEKKVKVREILFANEAIKAMTAGRVEGQDYWMDLSDVNRENSTHGDEGAIVDMVFAKPVSYAGEVPEASDPCAGHYGEDERVPEGDPCLKQAREYSTVYRAFTDVSHISGRVDTRRGEVVDLFAMYETPHTLEGTIQWFKQQYEERGQP